MRARTLLLHPVPYANLEELDELLLAVETTFNVKGPHFVDEEVVGRRRPWGEGLREEEGGNRGEGISQAARTRSFTREPSPIACGQTRLQGEYCRCAQHQDSSSS